MCPSLVAWPDPHRLSRPQRCLCPPQQSPGWARATPVRLGPDCPHGSGPAPSLLSFPAQPQAHGGSRVQGCGRLCRLTLHSYSRGNSHRVTGPRRLTPAPGRLGLTHTAPHPHAPSPWPTRLCQGPGWGHADATGGGWMGEGSARDGVPSSERASEYCRRKGCRTVVLCFRGPRITSAAFHATGSSCLRCPLTCTGGPSPLELAVLSLPNCQNGCASRVPSTGLQ